MGVVYNKYRNIVRLFCGAICKLRVFSKAWHSYSKFGIKNPNIIIKGFRGAISFGRSQVSDI